MPAIYVIDLPEEPFALQDVMTGRRANVVAVPVRDWHDSLTPWPAPGLYRGDADFGGRAAATLDELVHAAVPAIEREEGLHPAQRAICGYSLGGLFALYAFARCDAFGAMASLSGSTWYPGLPDRLRGRELDLHGRYAYFTVGSKEKRAGLRILRTVEAGMDACAGVLRAAGCAVDVEVRPGDHFHYQRERFQAGLDALEAWFQGSRHSAMP